MVLMSSAIAVSAVLLSELLARRVAKRIAGT
jgi:molybdate transport system permease protein